MWQCPKCETNNDTDRCIVCGENKPDIVAAGNSYIKYSINKSVESTTPSDNSNNNDKTDKKIGKITFIIAAAIIILLFIIFYYLD